MNTMSVSNVTLQAMKELGLTEYEILTYVSLVDGGSMTAADVSAVSKVPYSRIYDVLGRLEERGLIQVSRGRPTRYTAKSPSEMIRVLRFAREQTFEECARAIIEDLQPRFEHANQAASRDVWLLYGRSAVVNKILNMLDSAKSEVMLSVPTLDIENAEMMDADISLIIERVMALRTVRVRILTSSLPEHIRAMLPPAVEIRCRDRVFGSGIVVDRRQTLIMIAAGTRDMAYIGIYASAPVFAEMADTYFERLWAESRPI